MKKLLNLILLAFLASGVLLTSCDDDDESMVVPPAAPTIPAPTGSIPSASVGGSTDVTFNVTVPGGYASAAATAQGGTASISSEPAAGATSGSVVVGFTAGSEAGAASVTLTVTDAEGQSAAQTAVINVLGEGVELPGAISFAGIPATATIRPGQTLTVPNVTLTAEDGLASLAVSVNGTDVPELGTDLSGTSVTVDFEAPQTASFTPGNYTILFTLTDVDGDQGTFTHTLTVESTVVRVTENVTSDQTWITGNTYILTSRIAVEAGATLTIQEGVIVKGEFGSGANASALLIARDARLMAMGSATSPIIFTSIADEIQPGQIISPNLEPTNSGLWGGLIVLGNAPISADAAAVQIEGIPPSDTNGLYGGDNPEDNSGVIQYVSIRHGGSNIGEGNEINGLTLGGVGSGTTIDHVEIVANADDGIEPFGGTVDITNALVWNAGDDAFDTDQAWAGTMDNLIIICGADTDHALEIDGPEGSLLAGHTITNASIKGFSNSELANFRDAARGTFSNLYFFNFPDPAEAGRGDFDVNDDGLPNIASGVLTFSNLEVTLADGVSLDAVFRDGTDANATAVAAGANTVGADVSPFSFTWASAAGELSDF